VTSTCIAASRSALSTGWKVSFRTWNDLVCEYMREGIGGESEECELFYFVYIYLIIYLIIYLLFIYFIFLFYFFIYVFSHLFVYLLIDWLIHFIYLFVDFKVTFRSHSENSKNVAKENFAFRIASILTGLTRYWT
jgi:hypothetical protein